MSARLEALNEQLESIKNQIVEARRLDQPTDELVEQEKAIAKQLTKARVLLTENTSVLKG